VAVLYPAYIACVLPGFEEKINIDIATSRLSELDIRMYVDNAVSTKTCTLHFLEEKGKQVHIATDKQSVIVNFIRQYANDELANISLNMLRYMFRNLDKVNISYVIVYSNGHVSYVYDSICNSKFVCV
jgi:hypothetical protein